MTLTAAETIPITALCTALAAWAVSTVTWRRKRKAEREREDVAEERLRQRDAEVRARAAGEQCLGIEDALTTSLPL